MNDVNIKSPLPNHIHIDASSPQSLKNSIPKQSSYNLLDPIIKEIESDANITHTVNEAIAYFDAGLRDIGQSKRADELQATLVATQLESQKLQNDLIQYQTERGNIIREFIKEQENNVAEIQNIVDMLRDEKGELIGKNPITIAKFASNE